MGVQLQLSAFQDSPEEREQKKRASLRKRVIILFSTLGLALGVRLLIKDPPPPKQVDRSHDEIRYIPGMLDALPVSERVKLDPKVLAKMLEVDENARKGIRQTSQTALAQATYTPTQPLFEEEKEAFQYKENLTFQLQKKRKVKETVFEPGDTTKTTLVQFRYGGHIFAEKAAAHTNQVDIRVSRSLQARYPAGLVSHIRTDALTWEEPVPAGFVKVKPAKGITITVKRNIAERISVDEDLADEI